MQVQLPILLMLSTTAAAAAAGARKFKYQLITINSFCIFYSKCKKAAAARREIHITKKHPTNANINSRVKPRIDLMLRVQTYKSKANQRIQTSTRLS